MKMGTTGCMRGLEISLLWGCHSAGAPRARLQPPKGVLSPVPTPFCSSFLRLEPQDSAHGHASAERKASLKQPQRQLPRGLHRLKQPGTPGDQGTSTAQSSSTPQLSLCREPGLRACFAAPSTLGLVPAGSFVFRWAEVCALAPAQLIASGSNRRAGVRSSAGSSLVISSQHRGRGTCCSSEKAPSCSPLSITSACSWTCPDTVFCSLPLGTFLDVLQGAPSTHWPLPASLLPLALRRVRREKRKTFVWPGKGGRNCSQGESQDRGKRLSPFSAIFARSR